MSHTQKQTLCTWHILPSPEEPDPGFHSFPVSLLVLGGFVCVNTSAEHLRQLLLMNGNLVKLTLLLLLK